MRKLIVTCECGQRMQVPRSAIGRQGICPGCGRAVAITADNTSAIPTNKGGKFFGGGGTGTFWGRMTGGRGAGGGPEPTEEAKRRFGEAVDLYHQQRYAEALAIFNALAKQFPGNPNIETGREQCLNALKRPSALPGSTVKLLEGAKLDEETVKRVVLEKMLSGATDAIQLQAAELATRILGIGLNGKAPMHTGNGFKPEPEVAPEPARPVDETRVDVADQTDSKANGNDPVVEHRGIYDLGAAARQD